jgi:hypothetical protein
VVEQISDLGHYRRALLEAEKMGTLKIYLPKAFSSGEGAEVYVYVRRCLLYQDGNPPYEVTQLLPHEAVSVQDS